MPLPTLITIALLVGAILSLTYQTAKHQTRLATLTQSLADLGHTVYNLKWRVENPNSPRYSTSAPSTLTPINVDLFKRPEPSKPKPYALITVSDGRTILADPSSSLPVEVIPFTSEELRLGFQLSGCYIREMKEGTKVVPFSQFAYWSRTPRADQRIYIYLGLLP